jgi:fumarate hydratase subunit beta
MIGKGKRNAAVREAMQTHNAVYFVAVGGAAALISECIKAVKIIAYDDLGTEAIREMVVEDFPAVVGNDAHGGDLYEDGKKAYQNETN